MQKKYNIAVIGATGNIGREILQILEQRDFPINKIFCLASACKCNIFVPVRILFLTFMY